MNKSEVQKALRQNAKLPQWCPGCGDFGELNVIVTALAELVEEDAVLHEHATFEPGSIPGVDIKVCISCPERHFYPRYEPHTVVTDSGIGCAGQMYGYIGTHGAKTTHGRVLPFALGLSIVRPDIIVIPQGGDGDAFAIGGGHLVNFPGFNANVVYAVTNNEVYGLTKGQTSPSAPADLKTKSNPSGPLRNPLNPIALAISAGWTFVARLANVGKITANGGEFDSGRLAVDIFKRALRHSGASLVIFETECPTYNKVKTPEWLRERVRPIDPKHDPSSILAAISLAFVPEEKEIPVGVYYEIRKPTLQEKTGITSPLVNRKPNRSDVEKLMRTFA